MTAVHRPRPDHPIVIEPEQLLDAYAEDTRIAASASLVRRFQTAVAEERAGDRGVRRRTRAALGRLGARVALPGVSPLRAGMTTAVRLQGLVLLLLLVLALGLVAGGAGAAIISQLEGPTRGSRGPSELIVPRPSPEPVVPPPSASPAPSLRVQPLAQCYPSRDRGAHPHRRGRGRHRLRCSSRPVVTQLACALARPTIGQEAARPHVTRRPCAF